MPSHVAVVGNSPINVGIVSAADLALAGHKVNFAPFDDEVNRVGTVIADGCVNVQGDATLLNSGVIGTAQLNLATTNLGDAIKGAEVVVVDSLAADVDHRITSILPFLEPGQHVHFNLHGYWTTLRAHRQIKDPTITMSESTAPTQAGGYDDDTGVVEPHVLRHGVATGVFPASRTDEVFTKISSIFANLLPATSVLSTNLESMNFLGHPAIALCNIGRFDNAEERSELIDFYGAPNTEHAGKLAEALDRERSPLCAEFSIQFRPALEQYKALYGAEGASIREAIASGAFFKNIPPLPPSCWRSWLSMDIPYAHVPYVRLSEAVGIPAPLHRAIVDIYGALLGEDYWKTGLDLSDLGLDGLSTEQILGLVEKGVFQHQ